jgi:hypothetical protein
MVRDVGATHHYSATNVVATSSTTSKTVTYTTHCFGTLHAISKANGPPVVAIF